MRDSHSLLESTCATCHFHFHYQSQVYKNVKKKKKKSRVYKLQTRKLLKIKKIKLTSSQKFSQNSEHRIKKRKGETQTAQSSRLSHMASSLSLSHLLSPHSLSPPLPSHSVNLRYPSVLLRRRYSSLPLPSSIHCSSPLRHRRVITLPPPFAYVSAPAFDPDSIDRSEEDVVPTDQSLFSAPEKAISWGVIWSFLSNHKLRIAVSIASLVACTTCTLSMPLFSGYISLSLIFKSLISCSLPLSDLHVHALMLTC